MSPKTDLQSIRVKDPKATIRFYGLLGLSVIQKLSFPENSFDLYFLGNDAPTAPSHGKSTFDRQGLIELTHNYGTEDKPGFTVSNGNSEPHLGFARFTVSVNDVQDASKVLRIAGYSFRQDPCSSNTTSVITLDPDGYWVQLIEQHVPRLSPGTESHWSHRTNQIVLRVKDAELSIRYYVETLGMSLVKSINNSVEGSTLYLLGYPSEGPFEDGQDVSAREGMLGLLWHHGTEKKDGFRYHNGNEHPQGFGHICVTVDDINAACERLESLGVAWKKRLTDGKMKNVAFLLDPDNYWVELVQNERFTGKANF
ncbi:hypothetical protein MANI_120522 [Metarhizium anisopliae]|nr:hypothetical protein MANI_120522 [Metarhizium anisopliae]